MTTDVQTPLASPPASGPHRGRWYAGAAVVLVVLAGAGGYVAGRQSTAATFDLVGRPYSTQLQIGVRVHGWSYDIPLDVRWQSADGTWHDGDRPACLPPSGTLGPVRFGAVEVRHGGETWRHVVWVSCAG
jgi:hypothetical protein